MENTANGTTQCQQEQEKKKEYICPDDDCRGKLVYDPDIRCYRCLGACGVSWGVSSIEGRKTAVSSQVTGKMIGC